MFTNNNREYSYQKNRSYQLPKKPKEAKGAFKFKILALFLVIVIFAFGASKVAFAFPAIYGTAVIDDSQYSNSISDGISWPSGQSAVKVMGYGLLKSSPEQVAKPTASVAKTVTALALIKNQPLNIGEDGPTITFTEQDEEILEGYVLKGGSAVGVKAGQQISTYQALQYILIPSANNIADSMVTRSFGSMESYTVYANNMLKELNIENTTISDASGFSPKTTSTAIDLVKIGEEVLKNPVLAEIVSTWEISLPDGSKVTNTNKYLNHEGNMVVGIKTGFTDEAGGVLLTAAKRVIDGQDLTIISVNMGGENALSAQKEAVDLIAKAEKVLEYKITYSKGDVVGVYEAGWQSEINAVVAEDIYQLKWKNDKLPTFVTLNPISSPQSKETVVGAISSGDTTSKVVLSSDVKSPSPAWNVQNIVQ